MDSIPLRACSPQYVTVQVDQNDLLFWWYKTVFIDYRNQDSPCTVLMLNQHGDNSLTRINYQSSKEIDHSLEWEVHEYMCIFAPFPDFYNTTSGLLLHRSFQCYLNWNFIIFCSIRTLLSQELYLDLNLDISSLCSIIFIQISLYLWNAWKGTEIGFDRVHYILSKWTIGRTSRRWCFRQYHRQFSSLFPIWKGTRYLDFIFTYSQHISELACQMGGNPSTEVRRPSLVLTLQRTVHCTASSIAPVQLWGLYVPRSFRLLNSNEDFIQNPEVN